MGGPSLLWRPIAQYLGTLPVNNASLSRTMAETFMKSTYTLADMIIDSPFTMVEFREESTYEGNTVVLYLYGESEIETKEAALVITNKACMLIGPPHARILPLNTMPDGTLTDDREEETATQTGVRRTIT